MKDWAPGSSGVTVSYDPALVTPEAIAAAASRTGYRVRLLPPVR